MPESIIHDITTRTTPPPSSSLPNPLPGAVQTLREASKKVTKDMRNDVSIAFKT